MRYKWDEKSRYPESRYHLERHPWVLVSWGINNKRLGKDQSTLCSMYSLHFATSIASLHSWAACGTSHILHYFEFANENNSSLTHFETTCLDFLGLDTILVFNISLRQICASALTLWRHGASGVLQWLLQLRPRHTTVALCRKPHLRVLRKRGVRDRLYTSRAHGKQHIVLSPGMPHWCPGLSRYVYWQDISLTWHEYGFKQQLGTNLTLMSWAFSSRGRRRLLGVNESNRSGRRWKMFSGILLRGLNFLHLGFNSSE